MSNFSVHVFIFRPSNILSTFLVDKKKVQLLKERLIVLVLIFERKVFFNGEKNGIIVEYVYFRFLLDSVFKYVYFRPFMGVVN